MTPSSFEFATAGRIVFGRGVAARLGELTGCLGSKCLLVTGSQPSRWEALARELAAHAEVERFAVGGEPDTDQIDRAARAAREFGADMVVAVGGGSALDAGKAAAALARNRGPCADYLEGAGKGRPLTAEPLPMAAVPTTAGTGSEVTRNAVVTVRGETARKASMRDCRMLPDIALVDPDLLRGVPPAVAAASGADALVQLAEALLCCSPTPMADAMCGLGLPAVAASLPRISSRPDDEARAGMSFASLCGGMALANARLGAVHGLAGVVGALTGAAHGAICGALAPAVFRANLAALRGRAPNLVAIERFAKLGRLLCGREEATAEDAVARVAELIGGLALPALGEMGLSTSQHSSAAQCAQLSNSMKGNPVRLEISELEGILAAS